MGLSISGVMETQMRSMCVENVEGISKYLLCREGKIMINLLRLICYYLCCACRKIINFYSFHFIVSHWTFDIIWPHAWTGFCIGKCIVFYPYRLLRIIQDFL